MDSVLGPLLFLIYINDTFLAAHKVLFHLFADDTCIFHSNKNYKKLEDEINTSLDNITNWLKANKLMINVKKSNLIVFKVGNSQSAGETINIYIENQILEPKDTAKYLGVYIDKRLSWDRHIEHINSKLNRGIGILRKLRSYLQQDSLRTIYNSFLKPYIEYGTLAWGGAPNKYLDKIDKCIKRSMCTVLFKNRFDNVKPFYKHLNILPLTKNIKLLQGKFMWKLLAKKHPDSIIEQFPLHFNEAINNTNTEKLTITYYRTSIGKKSLLYQGYKIWNLEIPANIKNKESYNNFAKNYHKYLLDEI